MKKIHAFLSHLLNKARPARKGELSTDVPLSAQRGQYQSQTNPVDEHQEEQHQQDISFSKAADSLEFKVPDIRLPEVKKRWEEFSAKYARPEPVAVQFTKKIAQFQLKEKVEGLIEEILDKKWLITPPSLELAGAVRSETGVAPWADEEDIHRGTLSGEKYSLKIQYIPQADGKEQIELQIRPKPNENVAFSQLTVKIVNSKGEVLVSKLAPFFDEAGIATLEIPDELSEGEYAIVVE